MSTLIIGLTGGIGSGKTTVTDCFEQLGINIIDADIIAREVVAINSPALKAIATYFGNDYIKADGQLNRALLRTRIFANEADKQWLNNLLHPLIHDELIRQTTQASSPYCLLVAPLLIENNLLDLVDRVLVIDVSEDTQIARTIQRDKVSLAQVKAILASQITRTKRLAAADDVINNDKITVTAVKDLVLLLNKKYLALTKVV